jgi:hypothetical protein
VSAVFYDKKVSREKKESALATAISAVPREQSNYLCYGARAVALAVGALAVGTATAIRGSVVP